MASFFLSRIDVLLDPCWKNRRGRRAAGPDGREPARPGGHRQRQAGLRDLSGNLRQRPVSDLAAKGARAQRLLWASTSTKNPAYTDLKYVEPLIGPDTVNTLPLETLEAYRDHGNPAARLAEGLDKAAA